ncbi:MAG: ribbon-helix-helix domain-containing protein [Alphaproteobacteria bacterium]|nr:ribbon-helix-helix domain-containing protein [Alphaproteobacteria bacterium]
MALESRNVYVGGRRTSIRLEPEMWDALEDICRREKMTVNEFCSKVETARRDAGLTAATRVFLLLYFRAVASGSGVSPLWRSQDFWERT